MRKRPPTLEDEPLDIFTDERFSSALEGATRPTAPPSPAPAPAPRAPPPPAAAAERGAPRTARPGTTARLVAEASAATPDTLPLPEPNVPLKFRVPQSLRSEFHRFKAELAAALGGVALDDSNLARPLIEHFLVVQGDRILKEASTCRGQIKRPPNGDAVGMAEFDHAIGNIFQKATRRRSPAASSKRGLIPNG